MIHIYVNMYIAFVTPVMMLETETRSKNRCRKEHFGNAQDMENRTANIHQEFLRLFIF